MAEANGRVKSTKETVSAYGKGRSRRWRWSARIWPEGATKSQQYRRRGFETEEAATDDMRRVLAALREARPTTVAAAPATITLGQALDRLLTEKARKKTVAEYGRIANHLREAFGADTALHDITAAKISEYRAERMSKPSARTGRALKIASVNRPLAVLRHLLKLAAEEWGLLPAAPRVRLEREDQGRLRYLTKEEATRLLAAAQQSKNADLHDLIVVALGTGCRQGELLELTWDRVDRARGVIRLEVTKSKRRREVPLNRDVDAVLERRRQGGGQYVFRSSNWDTFRSAFEAAVRAAQIDDFRFHDLRHTFASWLVMAGRPLVEVKDLLGHATINMTLRYAHLAPEQLRVAVSALDGVLGEVTGRVVAEPADTSLQPITK